MPIFANQETNQFHLQGKNVSYIFTILKNGHPGHLYYGKKIRHRDDFSHLLQLPSEPLGNMCFPYEGDQLFSLEFLKQEFPVYGTSDFREPAVVVKHANGSRTSGFVYQSHRIEKGKPSLEGLPGVYVDSDEEAETLIVTLHDGVADVGLELLYTVFHERDTVIRSSRIVNRGEESITVERLLSASVDFPDQDYDFLHLNGAWIREGHVEKTGMRKGLQSIDSKKGVSSSKHNPFFALCSKASTEDAGEVYGFSLVYSGNFFGGVEVDAHDVSRAMIGINPFGFEWRLEKGESLQSPEAVMVYSDEGLGGMSAAFHELYRTRLARGEWRDRERPVLINNWEATYFDFQEDKLLDIAGEAADLGIELFVLDDGWFEGRNHDTSSLGDWTPDKRKLPRGLDGLREGMPAHQGFGIWVEPEMISVKSSLYEEHPDWVLGVEDRPLSHGRNQFILDLSRDEVVEHLYRVLSDVFSSADIMYVKWDMNRNMTEVGSREHLQGGVAHRYVLGLYSLLERLTKAFPHILFESCASGGNRFDPGMLHYMPQTWTSDNTDAVERLKIQWGTSLVYPLSSMGAHVSNSPNHQTGRSTPIETRFHTAMFGVFGYELDATALSQEEKEAVRKQVTFFKANRRLIQFGSFHRLVSPFEGNDAAWMVSDGNEAILAFYRVLAKPNPSLIRVRMRGLDPDGLYELNGSGTRYYGDELMNVGFLIPPFFSGTVKTENTVMTGDFQSAIWKFEKVGDAR
ncbi:alpha-galactosidase [Rossellomorea marisflavi]|uniref:alpha-galactosidase n=1 Tax=Rossellomorea marisflavi TaxID=189381 RepID=UPI00345A506A